jgi:Nitrile hydratase, alpha chain
MTTPREDPEGTRIAQEWAHALGQLSVEDERLITLFRLMGEVVDPRYEMNGIRVLVGRALVDPAFRSRVLDDADAALAELRGYIELPENVRVRCVENTADYLTIVLPPPSDALSERSRTLRDFIVTRTSTDVTVGAVGVDDNDITFHFGDIGPADHDHAHFGDPSSDGH